MTMFTLPRIDESERAPDTSSTGEAAGFGALRTSVGNLPLKQLHYRTRIVGLAIHTTIAQTYYNPFDECIEATYIFPIEGEQAVTDCEMWIGARVVRAALKERGQARAEYRRAIERGHRAALLEENRPETFSMKVGNIAPGEAVQVRIETVGHLPVVDGEWTLRIPLVVAPRYTSGIALPGVILGPGAIMGRSAGDGVAFDTDQVPDASAVTPPTWLPGFASPVDLKLEVNVQPGALATDADWSARMRSSLHAVSTELSGEGEAKSCVVRVLPGERVNRDFILRGDYARSSIAASVVVEAAPNETADGTARDDRSTIAIQLVPPKVDVLVPRDIVFLLDRSGSMSGWKMDAARRGISRLVDSLSSQDRFRVIAFDDKFESPSMNAGSRWAFANDENRYEAVRWLAKVDSYGGTEMGTAIKHALDDFSALNGSKNGAAAGTPARAKAIVLVTDGQITGEDSLLRLLGKTAESKRPQIFCLGVDRAVNGSVLQRLTKFTGGTYELVESQARLNEVLQRFAGEIGSPALRDLEVIAENSPADFEWVPGGARTLYAGRAMSIYGRAKVDAPLAVTVRGRLASGELWQQTLDVPASRAHDSDAAPREPKLTLLPMWARGRIRELEDTLISEPYLGDLLKVQIVECSLQSRVLSRFTAFVAVDETERVNVDGQVHKVMQPVEFPDGWQAMPLASIDREHLIPLHGNKATRERVQHVNRVSEPAQRSGLSSLPATFESLIVGSGVVSAEQWSDAAAFASRAGRSISDALLEMKYATAEQIAQVTADAYRLPYIDLEAASIDEQVIELVPESVARENMILPVADEGDALTIAMSDPADLETLEKLRFILDREIRTVVASRESIMATINDRYGQTVGESADSMLQEFTDTAIDFTETTDDADLLCDLVDDEDLSLDACLLASPLHSGNPLVDDDAEPLMDMSGATFSGYAPPPPSLRSPASLIKKKVGSFISKPAAAPVVRLVQTIIAEAISLQASHVIIRPEVGGTKGGGLEVVYVIDGKEVPRDHVPSRLTAALVTRLKVLCNLDVTATKPLVRGRIDMSVGDVPKSCEVVFQELAEGVSILLDFVSKPLAEAPEVVQAWWLAEV